MTEVEERMERLWSFGGDCFVGYTRKQSFDNEGAATILLRGQHNLY